VWTMHKNEFIFRELDTYFSGRSGRRQAAEFVTVVLLRTNPPGDKNVVRGVDRQISGNFTGLSLSRSASIIGDLYGSI
jgi:hypothetical protein